MLRDSELRSCLGPSYTVRKYRLRTSFDENPETTLAELAANRPRVVWLADSAAERALADRAFYLGKAPVVIEHEPEQQLVGQICHELGVDCQHISCAFVDEMRGKVVSAPRVERIFRRVLPDGCDLLCCADEDQRLPVRVLRVTRRPSQIGEASSGDESFIEVLLRRLVDDARDGLVAVINCRNPVIARIEARRAKLTAKEITLAGVLFFMGRIACGVTVPVEETARIYDALMDLVDNAV
jgi:hypothetical protein